MPMRGNGPGVTETQAAFIEWLVDPNRGTQTAWAQEHKVAQSTLSAWKRDGRFRKAWEIRLSELNVDPDRLQRVIDAIYFQATGGDTKAAALYLQYVDRFTPKSEVVTRKAELEDLDDDELAAELEEGAKHLRAVK